MEKYEKVMATSFFNT